MGGTVVTRLHDVRCMVLWFGAPNRIEYWSVTLLITFAYIYVVILYKDVPNLEAGALANFEVFVSPEVAVWVLVLTHL